MGSINLRLPPCGSAVSIGFWSDGPPEQSIQAASRPPLSHQPELVHLTRPISELFNPVWSEKFFVARRIAASPEVASPWRSRLSPVPKQTAHGGCFFIRLGVTWTDTECRANPAAMRDSGRLRTQWTTRNVRYTTVTGQACRKTIAVMRRGGAAHCR